MPTESEGQIPTAAAVAAALFEAEARAAAEAPPRRPTATYRLQLHAGFGLDRAAAIVADLHALGISDVYLSPFLTARAGSTHGYDVVDHRAINPEVGDDAAHDRLLAALDRLGMGRVLDVVPNHMGLGPGNPHWMDLLEHGRAARGARFFDVDWDPVKEELADRVLLPILDDQYGRVLESGRLTIERRGGRLVLEGAGYTLPLAPRSYAAVLGRRYDDLVARLGEDHPHAQEYLSIWAAARNLPPATDVAPARAAESRREAEVIQRRLGRLCAESPEVAEFLDRNVASFRGIPGDPTRFDELHRLLEQQAYRLAFWRTAAEEINYRRFFDITDLAGLRAEDPAVFEASHTLILDWVGRGGVTGLRIDHPDGLADPLGYFARLQEATFLRACRNRLADDHPGADWQAVGPLVQTRYREALAAEPGGPLARRFPIVAEKILSRGEDLPDDWPIDGTVGYEYLNVLNGLFVDPAGAEAIDAAYGEFTGDRAVFAEVVHQSKQLIARASLASELNMLARQLNRVSERERGSRDFTLNELRRALGEVVACFAVYRTYIRDGEPLADRDRGQVERAVARARRRQPDIDPSVFDFVRSALLLEHPEGASADDRAQRAQFVARFQQTTGPIQAKGLEDTAFYRWVRLAALNEVGGDPDRFGTSPSAFHALNAQRLRSWPGALNTTATHDTKRGEDARVRIDALSELADEWRTRLARWSRINARRKPEAHGAPAPDAREEYLFYQALVGSWPFGGPDDAAPEGLVDRLQEYMSKAVREAKLNTSWTDRDPSYVEAVTRFVADALAGPDAALFLRDFLGLQRRVARVGVVNSLAQALLKVASPGVPDLYQGTELWELSLVDPDNRRPVDYDRRRELRLAIERELAEGVPRAEIAARRLDEPDDGAIKVYLLMTLLNHRREHADLYARGVYRPLEADGPRRANLVAFGRYREGCTVVAVAPRLVAGLMGDDSNRWPLGPNAWGETRLILPDPARSIRWRDLLTDRSILPIDSADGSIALDLADVFAVLPVALLIGEGAATAGN